MKNIVVVGGGSAGWMAALMIADRFPEKSITVIDPKALGPIGVGESVTGVVIELVSDPLHGLSMGEFFRRCDTTFKMGIWYRDWQGPDTGYLSPLDAPYRFFKHNYETNAEEFYARAAMDGMKLGDIQLHAQLMRKNQTVHFRTPEGGINTQMALASCHFDALKFGAWIREVATGRANVKQIDATIAGFEQDPESGHVTKLRTDSGLEITGDFFIDCTGFHRLLFAKAYQPKWKSYADYLKVDSAIPLRIDYAEGDSIPNYTAATAMPHGWMWQIPTQSRLGRGYIYSSRYVSDDQAIAEFRATGVDVGSDPHILRFSPGRYETLWEGNVCTVGLSGAFSEPLEATTIHGMSVQIRLLTELLLPFCTRESLKIMADQFNRLAAAAYDDYVDFISFHYHTGRNDTEFWRDYQKPEALTPANQARLEKWRHAFPAREDFAPIYTQKAKLTSGLVAWAPMLCGLGLLNPQYARRVVEMSRQPQMLQENVGRYLQIRNHILASALSHRDAIRYFRELS